MTSCKLKFVFLETAHSFTDNYTSSTGFKCGWYGRSQITLQIIHYFGFCYPDFYGFISVLWWASVSYLQPWQKLLHMPCALLRQCPRLTQLFVFTFYCFPPSSGLKWESWGSLLTLPTLSLKIEAVLTYSTMRQHPLIILCGVTSQSPQWEFIT